MLAHGTRHGKSHLTLHHRLRLNGALAQCLVQLVTALDHAWCHSLHALHRRYGSCGIILVTCYWSPRCVTAHTCVPLGHQPLGQILALDAGAKSRAFPPVDVVMLAWLLGSAHIQSLHAHVENMTSEMVTCDAWNWRPCVG